MLLVMQDDPKFVTKFRYMEDKLMKRNCIHELIKIGLNSEKTCSHLAQNLMPARLSGITI